MTNLIVSVAAGMPAALVEVTKLGRTLKQRAVDVLAYFDRAWSLSSSGRPGQISLVRRFG